MVDTIDLPIATSDYFRQSAGNPSLISKNVYFEKDPTNQTDGNTLIRRPGLRPVLTVDEGPIRKIFHRVDAFNNAFFFVSNVSLYRAKRESNTSFYITPLEGVLASDTDISMTATSENLFITDQTGLFISDGLSSLVEIATPDDVGINKLGYIGGYIVCVARNSQRFYWIKPGETTIDPLDFAEAEGLPDGIVDMTILGDQIYFFGKETIEIWYLSGDSDAPFQRIQGKLLSVGALEGTSCIIFGEDTFFFLATDGTARIGPTLQKVSDPGIQERIRRAITDLKLANN